MNTREDKNKKPNTTRARVNFSPASDREDSFGGLVSPDAGSSDARIAHSPNTPQFRLYSEEEESGPETVYKNIGEILKDLPLWNHTAAQADTLTQILELSGDRDRPPWRHWWERVVPKVKTHPDGRSMLLGLIRKVEDAQNPYARQAKGIGEIRTPAKFMASEVLKWARKNRVKLPVTPKQSQNGLDRPYSNAI